MCVACLRLRRGPTRFFTHVSALETEERTRLGLLHAERKRFERSWVQCMEALRAGAVALRNDWAHGRAVASKEVRKRDKSDGLLGQKKMRSERTIRSL